MFQDRLQLHRYKPVDIRNLFVPELCRSAPYPSVALRTTALSPSAELRTSTQIHTVLSVRVRTSALFLLCLCVSPHRAFFCSTYLALRLLLHCVPPHCVFSCTAYPALTPWITCKPLIRAKLIVLQFGTDSQIHRSNHAPKRSRLIHRSALGFLLDLDLAF